MFTPENLSDISFTKAGKNGYKTEEVDEFLTFTQNLVRKMNDEKKELNNKIIILAEKIEEYRKDEDSLRAALLGAQRFGDNIVKEAKTKADAILKEANLKAEFAKADLDKEIETSKRELEQMKSEVSAFRIKMLNAYKAHIEMINSLPVVNQAPQTSQAQASNEEQEAQTETEE